MPERINVPKSYPTDADLAWYEDLARRRLDDKALDAWCQSLTQSERERWWRCAVYYASQSVDPETQTLLEEVQEAARKMLGEMRARGLLQITEGEDGMEFWLQLPH